MSGENADFAILTLPDGRTHNIRTYKGTAGEEIFLDIRDLQAKCNAFTYDPGFGCTASCSSSITFIDGGKGICLYRGIPIEDLCENSSFLEVSYLLMTGELPTARELELFSHEIKQNLLVHEKLKKMFENFRMDAHPMAIMVAVTGALSAFFSELDQTDTTFRWLAAVRMVAKFPTLAALAYKTHLGEPPVWPQAKLSFAENFLHMMFSTPLEEYKVNPFHARAIDAFLILHADHEQNASTSTVRIAGSSQANPYACIAAGIASLWGPAHGGANEAVIKMLEEIGHKEEIPEFLEKVKRKETRLMGFGHRVYKNFDPRAKQMKKLAHQILNDLEVADPSLELAMDLERIALEDEYFTKRKLYPNVDFYSGIILRAIGIPTNMFTVMFAMARCVGWCSHWLEMHLEDQMRIGRPRQLYVGSTRRPFIPISQRGERGGSSQSTDLAEIEIVGGDERRHRSVKGTIADEERLPRSSQLLAAPQRQLFARSASASRIFVTGRTSVLPAPLEAHSQSKGRVSHFIQGLAAKTNTSFQMSVPDDEGPSKRMVTPKMAQNLLPSQ
ncbi:unnamed protein product [Amoebophrya sp. A25]|nr:unnamed protein product [Amoebophrya sp. A25]|eukprot:GSA25T00002114001.1